MGVIIRIQPKTYEKLMNLRIKLYKKDKKKISFVR